MRQLPPSQGSSPSSTEYLAVLPTLLPGGVLTLQAHSFILRFAHIQGTVRHVSSAAWAVTVSAHPLGV